MALAEGRERIYVTVSSEMASRIDFYCEKMGLTRSALCAYFVGHGVMGMDRAMGMVDKMGEIIASKATEPVDIDANTPEQLTMASSGL